MVDCNFPYDYQSLEVCNSNLDFNHQTAHINQFEPVVSGATLLASVMVEQPIIQAAMLKHFMVLGVSLSPGSHLWKMQHKF